MGCPEEIILMEKKMGNCLEQGHLSHPGPLFPPPEQELSQWHPFTAVRQSKAWLQAVALTHLSCLLGRSFLWFPGPGLP